MRKLLTIVLATTVLQGCVVGHMKFYEQVAPSKYPPTERVMQFQYSNISLSDFYQTFFSDFLIIGRSSFNGPYEDPKRSLEYAKSIGADIFVSTAQLRERRTTYSAVTSPTSSTSYVSGSVGTSLVSGTVTSYGTTTTIVPVQVDRYIQEGLYLKNVNRVTPLWERTGKDYPETEQTSLTGTWKNQYYKLSLHKSNQYIVATLRENLTDEKDREGWKENNVKFVFDAATGIGIYLMASKAPMPADFAVSKFGHLEVKLSLEGSTVSFEKVK